MISATNVGTSILKSIASVIYNLMAQTSCSNNTEGKSEQR